MHGMERALFQQAVLILEGIHPLLQSAGIESRGLGYSLLQLQLQLQRMVLKLLVIPGAVLRNILREVAEQPPLVEVQVDSHRHRQHQDSAEQDEKKYLTVGGIDEATARASL